MIIPVGFAQITWLFSGNGLPNGAATTLGVSNGVILDPGDLATLALESWIDSFRASQSQDITITGARVKFGPVSTGPMAEIFGGAPGGQTGSAAPPNVAALIRKRTALGGRMNRGRMYVPGVPEQSIDPDGTLAAGIRGDLQDAADELLGLLAVESVEPVILHSASSDPTPIVSLEADGLVATQRRRLR